MKIEEYGFSTSWSVRIRKQYKIQNYTNVTLSDVIANIIRMDIRDITPTINGCYNGAYRVIMRCEIDFKKKNIILKDISHLNRYAPTKIKLKHIPKEVSGFKISYEA